jgi:hypothetical protein
MVHEKEIWTGSENFDEELHEDVLAYWQSTQHDEE